MRWQQLKIRGLISTNNLTTLFLALQLQMKKPLEIHFHSDFGMGVANTINAVLAGAEVIHSTVLGIGERAGNTPMEETALALLTMYGIDVGIDFGKLNELSKMVQQFAGVEIPASRPFIGKGAYTIESGIVTGWFKNTFGDDPTTVFPVHPDFVGHDATQILMGKKSGLDNIAPLKIWVKSRALAAKYCSMVPW